MTMESIILTEEHKSKLLEMCNELFKDIPYFNSVSLCDQELRHGMNCSNESKIFVAISIKYGLIYPITCIHWFEFCMTHLVEKILNPNPDNPNRSLQNKFKTFFWETNIYWEKNRIGNENNDHSQNKKLHPIDYLYDEFKKLKI